MSKGLDPDQNQLSVLIICKGYQQTTKVAASKERVKFTMINCFKIGLIYLVKFLIRFSTFLLSVAMVTRILMESVF